MAGAEIAAVLWPILKILGALALVWAGVKHIEKGGGVKNERDALKGAERGRIKHEKRRADLKAAAVARWHRRRGRAARDGLSDAP